MAGKPWIKHAVHWKNVKYVFYDNSIKEKNKKSKFCANKSEFCANQKRKKHGNLKTTKNT